MITVNAQVCAIMVYVLAIRFHSHEMQNISAAITS